MVAITDGTTLGERADISNSIDLAAKAGAYQFGIIASPRQLLPEDNDDSGRLPGIGAYLSIVWGHGDGDGEWVMVVIAGSDAESAVALGDSFTGLVSTGNSLGGIIWADLIRVESTQVVDDSAVITVRAVDSMNLGSFLASVSMRNDNLFVAAPYGSSNGVGSAKRRRTFSVMVETSLR
jgi:hypothetical protein